MNDPKMVLTDTAGEKHTGRREIVIGIDLGGTYVRAALVEGAEIVKLNTLAVRNKGTDQQVLEDIFQVTDPLMATDAVIKGIGIGVPSVVDTQTGVVYDVQHIAAWKAVALKSIMEDRYRVPVQVNNDANAFVLGEYYFGRGSAKGASSVIGLTVGTGIGVGVIIHHQLYEGANCGAGEFGSVRYLDKNLEYYASGSFFQHVYGIAGGAMYTAALKGADAALAAFAELGRHLAEVIKTILYAYDPAMIVIGGSVAKSWPLIEASLKKSIAQFDFPKSLEKLCIEPSALQNSGVLGAAALHYNYCRSGLK